MISPIWDRAGMLRCTPENGYQLRYLTTGGRVLKQEMR